MTLIAFATHALSPRSGFSTRYTATLWNIHSKRNEIGLASSHRSLFNTRQNPSKDDDTTPAQSQSILLYKRDASRSMFPRAILTFSGLHTSYWLWYVFDFTPTINTKGIEALVIDPTLGYAGLGLSIFMSMGALLYPKSLIEEISLSDDKVPGERSLFVQTYSLPFVTPSSPKKYPVGSIVLDSHNDAMKVMSDYHGDIRKLSGYLPLQAEKSYVNYLLHFTKDKVEEEVKHPSLLLQALVPPAIGNILSPVKQKERIMSMEQHQPELIRKTKQRRLHKKRKSKKK